MHRAKAVLSCILLIGAFLFSAPSPAVDLDAKHRIAAAIRDGQPVRIALVGDSVAWGSAAWPWDSPQHNSISPLETGPDDPRWTTYANQFRAYLKKKNPASDVANLSKGGYTSARHLKERTIDELARRGGADVVIIVLGINDAFSGSVSPDEYRANLMKLIDQVQAIGAAPVLMKENAIFDKLIGYPDTEGHVVYKRRYLDQLDDIARERGLGPVIDAWTPFNDQFEKKGFAESGLMTHLDQTGKDAVNAWHPGQTGHDLYLDVLIAYFTP